MLHLAQYVLKAVSNQPEILQKEYYKFLNWIQPSETIPYTEWCLKEFGNIITFN